MSDRQKIIVLTWSAMDGSAPTGKSVWRDGCYRAELETVREARALVWSRDIADLEPATSYACQNGFQVRVLPDSDDVLDIARKLELERADGVIWQQA